MKRTSADSSPKAARQDPASGWSSGLKITTGGKGVIAHAGVVLPRLLADRIEAGSAGPGGGDYKTRLQEYAAREFEQLPRYQVRAEGPDHSKHFFAMVTIRGAVYGHGQGRSKKQAEQAAARAAWTALTRDAGAP